MQKSLSCLPPCVEEGKNTKATAKERLPFIPLATTLLLEGTDRSYKGSCYSYVLIFLCSLK